MQNKINVYLNYTLHICLIVWKVTVQKLNSILKVHVFKWLKFFMLLKIWGQVNNMSGPGCKCILNVLIINVTHNYILLSPWHMKMY